MNNASRVVEEYNKSLKEIRHKTMKGLKLIAAISSILAVSFFFLSEQAEVFVIVFSVFAGIALIFIIILLLFMLIPYTNQKLLYNTVYPEIIKDINYNEDISIECEVITKNKEHIANGGLFTKYASVDNKFQLQFLNKEGFQVSISDSVLITSNGKSSTVHFDGIYFVFKMENRQIFQLRSSSSPNLSKVKFDKINSRDDIKEYVEEEGKQSIDSRFYTLFDFLKKKYPAQKVYISGVEKEIHVAIWRGEKRDKYPKLSVEDLNNIRNKIMEKILLSEEIYNMISI